jgi:hypothetical protein
MSGNPELIDYTAFFEAEPKTLHPEVGWTCGAQFDSVRGEERIIATVAPSEGTFSFKWWEKGLPRADLSLQGVVEWVLECNPGSERLILKFHQRGIEYFIIQLKPNISVSCVIQSA